MSAFTVKSWGQVRELIMWVVVVGAMAAAQPFLWGFAKSSALELQRVRTEDEQYKVLEERLVKIEESSAGAQAKVGRLELSFPAINSTPQVINRVEGLGELRGIELEILNIREEAATVTEDQARIVPLVVTVTATGPIGNLLDFLVGVEHLQEFAAVPSWALVPAPVSEQEAGTADQARFRLNATISFYLLDLPT